MRGFPKYSSVVLITSMIRRNKSVHDLPPMKCATQGDDDLKDTGFHLTTSNQGASAVGPGFSLKFWVQLCRTPGCLWREPREQRLLGLFGRCRHWTPGPLSDHWQVLPCSQDCLTAWLVAQTCWIFFPLNFSSVCFRAISPHLLINRRHHHKSV